MAPYKDEPPAVCVYTVCDESRYLIVRNVLALGCGDDLFNCSPPMEMLKSVNQWMQRTVSLSLMYSGSNFVWSTMPGALGS
nr:hypothetical protein CFP56_17741 [Quercus suber]